MIRCFSLLLILLFFIPNVDSLNGQTADRLARLQEEARKYLRDLQGQMETLAKRLDEDIPEDSQRLRSARQKIIQDLIEDDMRAVTEALSSDDYVKALETTRKVRANLELVLSILESSRIDPEAVESDLQKVNDRLGNISELADTQRSLLDVTKNADEAEQDIRDLEEVQDDLGSLIDAQENLSDTPDSSADNSQLADQAMDLSKGVQNLADRLTREARRQRTLSAVSRQIQDLQQQLEQDLQEAQEQAAANNGQPAGDLGERSNRAKSQARDARSLSERINSIRREATADADNGDTEAEEILEDLEEASQALQEAAQEAEKAASAFSGDPSESVDRSDQKQALSEAQSAIQRAGDSNNERTGGLREQLQEMKDRLGDWIQNATGKLSDEVLEAGASAQEDLNAAGDQLDE